MPGIAVAGRFYEHGRWMFRDIHEGESGITIDIDHEKYNMLVVEVADAAATASAIGAWLKG